MSTTNRAAFVNRLSIVALLALALAAVHSTGIVDAQNCQYSVSPTSVALQGPGTQRAIRIDTQPACAWTATIDADWMALLGSGGVGPGDLVYAVATMDPASQFPIRQGRIRVRWNTPTAGQDVLVTQAIGTCRLDGVHFDFRAGTSPRTFGAAASGGRFFVLTQNVFDPWFVASAPDWIQVKVPYPAVLTTARYGYFTIQANPTAFPRAGAIQFCDGRTLEISQAGRSPRNGLFVPADFDDDGKADLAVYRPSSNEWYVLFSSANYNPAAGRRVAGASPIGLGEDWRPLAGDFDGDRRNDLLIAAVFRHDIIDHYGLQWSLLSSSDDYAAASRAGLDVRVQSDRPSVASTADFDGDGIDEFVSYMSPYFPAGGQWRIDFWGRLPDAESRWFRAWGARGDIPVPADFDGDGRADFAVWRPSDGRWYVLPSRANYAYESAFGISWGAGGDVPVHGDFDGDGKADPAVWRPSNGTWYFLFSSTEYAYPSARAYQWGRVGDLPVPADYDGDGRTDIAVWRPENGTWYLLFSSAQYSHGAARAHQWGAPGDKPVTR